MMGRGNGGIPHNPRMDQVIKQAMELPMTQQAQPQSPFSGMMGLQSDEGHVLLIQLEKDASPRSKNVEEVYVPAVMIHSSGAVVPMGESFFKAISQISVHPAVAENGAAWISYAETIAIRFLPAHQVRSLVLVDRLSWMDRTAGQVEHLQAQVRSSSSIEEVRSLLVPFASSTSEKSASTAPE